MRQAARQSARWIRRHQTRTVSPLQGGNCLQQRRPFSAGPIRLQDNKPPNGSSEHEKQLKEQREREQQVRDAQQRHQSQQQQQSRDDDVSKQEESVDGDADQHQQNGDREARRSGLSRRTYRQRRTAEAPKPPPIPEWFLKHNVQLEVERVQLEPAYSLGFDLKCYDTETGHILFTAPNVHAYPAEHFKPTEYWILPRDAISTEDVLAEQPTPLQAPLNVDTESNDGASTMKGFFDSKQPPQVEAKEEPPIVSQTEDQHITYAEFIEVHKPRLEAERQELPEDLQARQQLAEEWKQGKSTCDGVFELSLPEHLRHVDDVDSLPLHTLLLEIVSSAHASLSMVGTQQPSPLTTSRVDISLVCPDDHSHRDMDGFVQVIATMLQADTITLDANDLAELSSEYVGGGHDSIGSFASLGYDVFDGFAAATPTRAFKRPSDVDVDQFDENELDDEEEVDDSNYINPGMPPAGAFGSIDDLRKALEGKKHELSKALGGIPIVIGAKEIPLPAYTGARAQNNRRSAGNEEARLNVQWEDQRLGAFLDSLLDAPNAKQEGAVNSTSNTQKSSKKTSSQEQNIYVMERQARLKRFKEQCRPYWPTSAANFTSQMIRIMERDHGRYPSKADGEILYEFDIFPSDEGNADSQPLPAPNTRRRIVVHIRDLKDLCASPLGDAIVEKLVRVVQKRRRKGQEIIIIGSTSKSLPGSATDLVEEEGGPFRTIVVPPLFYFTNKEFETWKEAKLPPPEKSIVDGGYHRILEINLRHIQSMLRRLRPDTVGDLMDESTQRYLHFPGTAVLSKKVLSLNQVQRLVLTAIGLSHECLAAPNVQPLHVAATLAILSRNDRAVQSWQTYRDIVEDKSLKAAAAAAATDSTTEAGEHNTTNEQDKAAEDGKARIEQLKSKCNPHEVRLLSGVVDPSNIKTAFADVHAPAETIDALKTLTTLSLLRPDAFKYGVLANDRLPGLLLYGPPGTGKTLLAKAVAKESQATVLEVSGAQIYEKYVGEGEKMVKAVFSLAKKLSPCIVFIDEADAIFGSRGGHGNRNTHREIINQFLREWDGMDDHSVFMMVASNRPFDLDDAVLRRLPRRLLIDLPTVKDREGILNIHLKGEILASTVQIAKLAEQTPLYSGSDLKNLCVAAALAAVREENDLMAQHAEDKEFKLPEKRTLEDQHFEKAIQEISASISEDMSSLTAIRKFDEQFGDRRGRKKKNPYGFGLGGENANKIDEDSIRVRQADIKPASTPQVEATREIPRAQSKDRPSASPPS
ncbi:AAA-domain-containing protein [Polychaeton citri CBS 116435]|uniref:AAA-domain-containing protein n=1 Tax=Polychaeton citri CBS 116435 TaxID=1314669 RepID=A0A9P4QBE0_9PEZI|nr:AAA-domain-containing protein [Polychaeton citri CBS 116435]